MLNNRSRRPFLNGVDVTRHVVLLRNAYKMQNCKNNKGLHCLNFITLLVSDYANFQQAVCTLIKMTHCNGQHLAWMISDCLKMCKSMQKQKLEDDMTHQCTVTGRKLEKCKVDWPHTKKPNTTHKNWETQGAAEQHRVPRKKANTNVSCLLGKKPWCGSR